MMVVNGGRNINLVLSYTNNIDVINYSAMAGKAVLICQQNSHSFLDRTLNLEQPVKIGRSVARARAAQNNGIFDCKVLSRNHALFWYANGKFFLQDTKSSNGTFVNNQRLSKSGEESSPREVCSGDIVQFGVDVLENSRKVTHGCIVASLKLYLPDGKEAKASPSTAVLSCVGSVPVEDLYQLNQHIQEALQREQMLQTKLSSLQQLVMSLQQASDLSWKALIAEDRLLSRVETLETQLQTYSKNFGEDKLREELRKLNEDKNCYQTTAKECLKKILEEKVEANQKCEDIKISLMNTEAECANFKELMEQSHGELRELALKHSAQTAKNEELQDKLQASEDQLKDVTSKLESVKEELNHELQKLVGNEVVLQERINKLEVTSQMEVREYKIEPKPRSILEQFTAIYDHLPEFNTDETSDDQDIYLERIDDDEAQDDPRDISSRVDRLFDQLITVFQDQQKTKEVVDILAAQLNFLQGERGAKLQRITALENELELHSSQLRTFRNDNVILEHKLNSLHEIVEAEIQSPDCDVTMKIETEEMVTKSTLYNLQAEMSELKELLTEAQKKSEIAEQKVKVLQIDLDLAKNSLSETTENLTRTKEKLQDAEKIKEGRDTTVALLKQQMKTIETSRMETTLQEKLEVQHNSINKQEEETLLLKKQLLESQHVAKQHKNEIEHLKEQLLVLAEEHEGKLNDDTTDNWENSLDNRAREDFSALQQECSTLKETIKTLESQLLKLKTESRLNQELFETRRSIEEAENESAAMKIDKEIAMEDNKEEMEISRIKISELEEELVLVKERYVSCNEDKTRLEKEFTLLKQDFQGVSQQSSYFNFVCALPLLILFIAFTIAFYPTLSCLFGTTDKPQPPLD